MNRNICEKCKRYGGKYEDRDDVWLCASVGDKTPSDLIPQMSQVIFENFVPLAKTNHPPKWCEMILEQTIVEPDEIVKMDERCLREMKTKLVWDGNDTADFAREMKMKNHIRRVS